MVGGTDNFGEDLNLDGVQLLGGHATHLDIYIGIKSGEGEGCLSLA